MASFVCLCEFIAIYHHCSALMRSSILTPICLVQTVGEDRENGEEVAVAAQSEHEKDFASFDPIFSLRFCVPFFFLFVFSVFLVRDFVFFWCFSIFVGWFMWLTLSLLPTLAGFFCVCFSSGRVVDIVVAAPPSPHTSSEYGRCAYIEPTTAHCKNNQRTYWISHSQSTHTHAHKHIYGVLGERARTKERERERKRLSREVTTWQPVCG